MNEVLKTFSNKEFGEIRTVMIDNEPWFVGKDIAEALGYVKPRNAISIHVADEDKKDAPIQGTPGGTQKMTIINESGMYALILSSKLESAKRFKHWVTSEVLPSIRKHGGYIEGQEDLTDEQLLSKALLYAQSKIEERDRLLLEQKPLVEFAEHVSETEDTLDMEEIAKIFRDEELPFGRNRMMKAMRELKILKTNNVPYQTYIERGYFDVKEVTRVVHGKTKIFPKTVITGKGQIWLLKKLKEYFSLKEEGIV